MAFSRDDILAKMGIDVKDFNAGLDDAAKKSESFSKKLGKTIGSFSFSKLAIGATAAAAAVGYVGKALADAADDLKDASEALDLNVESLQRFESAFAAAGVESDKFRKAFSVMTSEIDKALGGDKNAIKAFQDVGVSLNMLKGLSPEEIFMRVADGIKEADTYGKALNQTMAIFGAKAKNLTPLLREGGDEIKKSFENATIASQEAIDNLADLADAWTATKKAAIAYGIEAANALTKAAQSPLAQGALKFTPAGLAGEAAKMIAGSMQPSTSKPSAANTNVEKAVATGAEKGVLSAINKAPAAGRGKFSPALAGMEAAERNKRQWQKNAPGAGRNEGGMTDAALNQGLTTEQARLKDEHEKKTRESIDEKTAEMREEQRKKDEKLAEKTFDQWDKAGLNFAKKISDAADSLAQKASDFQKTGQERREDRQVARDQKRAERTVKAREADTADRERRGAYDSEEERQKIERDKRAGIKGADGKGPAVGAADKSQKTLEDILGSVSELVSLYGKST